MVPDKLLNYKNAKVVSRFASYYKITTEEAEKIFEQMKLFLFVSVQFYKETGKRIQVVDEMFVLDEMWHYFILFTEDYHHFCYEMFNEFYHHTPSINRDNSISASELTLQMQYIGNILGSDALLLWYSTWAKEYSARRMHELYIVQTA